jgi:hypothetical protein
MPGAPPDPKTTAPVFTEVAGHVPPPPPWQERKPPADLVIFFRFVFPTFCSRLGHQGPRVVVR